MVPLLNQLLQDFLTQHGLLGRDRQTHYVVAYSGGRDSTALLHGLTQLRDQVPNLEITAAYYWHPWRPLQDDLELIYQNCKRLAVPLVMLTPNLTLPKTETAAREDRYSQLARLCESLDATAVLTAHHQDDQVETLLFRLFRGTGIEGLQGIPEVRQLLAGDHKSVDLGRPLIDIPRTIINQHVNDHQLRYVEDPTNQDTRMKRNYIRHQVLPVIESAFPNAREALIKLAHLTEGEIEIIDSKMTEVWSDVYNPQRKGLNEVRFTQLSAPFQRRVVRQFLEDAGYEAGLAKVEEVIAFIGGKNRNLSNPGLFSLDKDHFLSVFRGVITIESPDETEIEPVPVSIPGQVSHRTFKTSLYITPLTSEQRVKPVDYTTLPPNELWVDLSAFKDQELILRGRQKGDRIQPLGMQEPIKLKRYLINRGIPRFRRNQIPVLAIDSKVLWALGVGMSEDIRVKDKPTHRITFTKG